MDFCNICQTESFGLDKSKTCQHKYHSECLDRWIASQLQSSITPTCPTCKVNLLVTEAANIPLPNSPANMDISDEDVDVVNDNENEAEDNENEAEEHYDDDNEDQIISEELQSLREEMQEQNLSFDARLQQMQETLLQTVRSSIAEIVRNVSSPISLTPAPNMITSQSTPVIMTTTTSQSSQSYPIVQDTVIVSQPISQVDTTSLVNDIQAFMLDGVTPRCQAMTSKSLQCMRRVPKGFEEDVLCTLHMNRQITKDDDEKAQQVRIIMMRQKQIDKNRKLANLKLKRDILASKKTLQASKEIDVSIVQNRSEASSSVAELMSQFKKTMRPRPQVQ